MEIGTEISKIRKKAKITQQALADQVGVDRVVINKIENGKRNPSEALFVRILESMGYTLQKKIVKNKVTFLDT